MQSNRRNFIKSNAMIGLWAGLGAISLARPAAGKRTPTKDIGMDSLLAKYQECLGGPFPEPVALSAVFGETIQKDGFRLTFINYEVEAGERVPAILLIPDGVNKSQPAPGIAVWHQHNGEYHLGKSEPAGLAGNPMQHTAVDLVKEGYVVLCPDALCFEERQDPTGVLEGGEFERFEFLRQVVRGRSLAWKNILDMQRAVDFLSGLEEVRSDKLGCYGHSMGSTHSWLVGPIDSRLKCIVGNCCLPTYEAIEEKHLLHCFPNFVPGWKTFGDTPEIAALIAPRALHLNLGGKDTGSPIEWVTPGVLRIAEAYQNAGAADKFSYFIEQDAGHELTELMWKEVKACFYRHLMAP